MVDLKVNDIWIPGTKQWDIKLIEELFNERDAKAISEMPLGRSTEPDQAIWHFSKNGVVSVRSAYRVWTDQMSTITLHHSEGHWEGLWNIHSPPKAKIMAWRLARNIIPTRETLRQRHIDVAGECS
ncbi:Putative ribonuclease H protein At1g65750 [Linum perenne]